MTKLVKGEVSGGGFMGKFGRLAFKSVMRVVDIEAWEEGFKEWEPVSSHKSAFN